MILQAIVQRWFMLGWVGRLASLAAALFGVGWIAGNLGLTVFARQLGSTAIFVASVLIVLLIARQVLRDHTGPRHQ